MKAIHPKGDHLMQSCMGPKLKDRKLLMGGRNSFHHGHESAVDQRNLNTWSTSTRFGVRGYCNSCNYV